MRWFASICPFWLQTPSSLSGSVNQILHAAISFTNPDKLDGVDKECGGAGTSPPSRSPIRARRMGSFGELRGVVVSNHPASLDLAHDK
jgi:hypothetical protein